MLFMITHACKDPKAARDRWTNTEEKWDGLELVARYHAIGNTGFRIEIELIFSRLTVEIVKLEWEQVANPLESKYYSLGLQQKDGYWALVPIFSFIDRLPTHATRRYSSPVDVSFAPSYNGKHLWSLFRKVGSDIS